jgi:hypothetical protein
MTSNLNANPAALAGDDILAALRIDQTYASDVVGVKRPLLTVPVRKPTKKQFVRVHPEHLLDCFGLEIDREYYFVVPALALTLAEFIEPLRLRLYVTRQGNVFLWPVKLPKDPRRPSTWHTSAAEAVALAEKQWTRVASDMDLNAYQPHVAMADLGDPKWPEESWMTIVRVALRDKMIETESHPVVRGLLGQA